MGICNDIHPTCDTCFELVIEDCLDPVTIPNLNASTEFFVDIISMFDVVTQQTLTSSASGVLTIDQTSLTISPHQVYEVIVYADSARTQVVEIAFGEVNYPCIIFSPEEGEYLVDENGNFLVDENINYLVGTPIAV